MKRVINLLLIAVVSATVVLLGGVATTDKTKYNNDFVRLFPPHAADVDKVYEITTGRVSLIGISNDIFLKDSRGILIIRQNGDTSRINLDVPFGFTIRMDSPFFYVYHGPTASVKRGNIQTWKIDTAFSDFPGFVAIQMISVDNPIIQTINITERQNELKKPGTTKKYILKKQVDGLLCTDGLLRFSRDLNQLIYVYRYRNQFIYLDTALNIIKYGKTIDTTSVAKISVAEVGGKITMAKPPLAVNNDAYVDGKYLFIQSNLMARNEMPKRAKGKSVFDVYDLTDGSYRFSFYIENYDGSRVQEFMIKGSRLVALFKQAVITYDLPEQYLP